MTKKILTKTHELIGRDNTQTNSLTVDELIEVLTSIKADLQKEGAFTSGCHINHDSTLVVRYSCHETDEEYQRRVVFEESTRRARFVELAKHQAEYDRLNAEFGGDAAAAALIAWQNRRESTGLYRFFYPTTHAGTK